MKNVIIILAVLVTCLFPFTVASAGLRSEATPVGDANPIVLVEAPFTLPEVRGSITSLPRVAKVVSNHGQFRTHHVVTCDPVVYVLGGSFQRCR